MTRRSRIGAPWPSNRTCKTCIFPSEIFSGMRSRSEEALLELQEEIKLDPNHPQAHYEIGDILYGQGKLAEAETHLLKAVKINLQLPKHI